MRLTRLRFATALVASVCLLVGAELRAASKVNIALIGDKAPGGGQFLGPSLTGMPAAAGNGWVAFRTLVTDGKTPEQLVVARLSGQEERHVVAALGTSAGKRDGKDLGTFKQFLGRPAVNANGDVVFAAALTNSEALPGGLEGIGLPPPAGIFLSRRGVPEAQTLRIVALARDAVPGFGILDLTTTIDPLETSTSLDLLEHTPALNDGGAVAFLGSTFAEGDFTGKLKGGIFVVDPAGGMTLRVRFGDTTPWGVITALGAPAMNASGVLAFRGTTDEITDGIFTFDGTTLSRLAFDLMGIVPPTDPELQFLLGFGALVAINDAGDVTFAAGGLFDLNFGTEDQFGVLVARQGTVQLVTYPGLEVPDFGRVRGGSLGPEGGNEVALPGIGPDGSVYVMAQLTGTGGHAFFRAQPPDYELSLPLVVFGGSRPDPSPIGGVFAAAISPPAVDATGGLAFFGRLAGAPELEALIYRPTTGDGNLILVGQATPTDGKFGGPPFSALTVNDDDVVIFKSAITRGPSSLGFFRWRRTDPEDSRLTALVRTGDPAPFEGNPPIIDLPGEASINALGEVAFSALIARTENVDVPSGRGIFTIGAGGMRVIAMPNDPLPFVAPDAALDSIATNPLIFPDGSVVFRARFGYEDTDAFEFVREDGIFRVSPAGDLALLARTGEEAPSGHRIRRFRDSNSTGGTIIVRAPLETTDELQPSALFLVDPSAAIRFVLTDQDALTDGNRLSSFTGRAAVDVAGNVAFLGRIGVDERVALIHRNTSGDSRVISMVGGRGPGGGQTKSVGRPAMNAAGHVAFRTSFERFDGGTPGFYLDRGAGPEPFLAIGEADPEGTGKRLSSLNPAAALNGADHLAFVGSVNEGDSRNGIFFASPTRTTVASLTVRGKERDIQGIPTLLASARGRLTLEAGAFGKAIAPSRQVVTMTLSDASGSLFTATVPRGGLAKGGGGFHLAKRGTGLRKLAVKGRRGSIRISFKTRAWELPFRSRDQLVPPLTLRVDVGPHSGTVIVPCSTAPGGNASCP